MPMRSGHVSAQERQSSPTEGFNRSPNGVLWLTVPGWKDQQWLWSGFSTRQRGVSSVYSREGTENEAGELNLAFTAHDTQENVRENRLRFIEAVTEDRETPLVTARQIHSCRSVTVAGALGTASIPDADGLMTAQAGILLGIQTADCIPVLVADPVRRAVAAFHAGWRGTVTRIVELGVAQMREEFGSDPADLIAAIGPGIGQCCYTVGAAVLERFAAGFSYSEELFLRSDEALRLDLVEANRRQLLAAGLQGSSIAIVGGCTSCQPGLFYSHRASGGHAGRMMAVIGVR
jgi:purine-nucleoside/S-methyl-5'-thioadenosine phosphorylase / adenosine deaminase